MFKFVRLLSFAVNVTATCLSLTVSSALAVDVVKIVSPQSSAGKSTLYKNAILKRALEVTEPTFGEFQINSIPLSMNPERAISEIQTGKIMNVAVIAANQRWDEAALPIKIPVRGGTLSYRLLLINKSQRQQFSKIETTEQLKALTAGTVSTYITTPLLKANGAKVITPSKLDNSFLMLEKNRVDYIPRAIYEAFDELSMRSSLLEQLVIEPNIALYIPMVSYMYVSKAEPRIAERLQQGMEILVKSGEMRKIFDSFYQLDVSRAQLNNRRIFTMNNPYIDNLLSKQSFDQTLMWQLH